MFLEFIKEKFFRNEFNKNSIILVLGTFVAQLFPVLGSPLLTRLYSPSDFGFFALFLSISSILGNFSTGKYELAIFVPAENSVALSLTRSSILLVVLFSGLLVVLSLIIVPFAWGLFKHLNFIFMIIVAVLLLGLSQSLTSLNNRNKEYKTISYSRVALGISWLLINVILGFWKIGYYGLIIGYIVGQFVSVSILFMKQYVNLGSLRNYFDKRSWVYVKEYKSYPLYFLPSQGLNAIASQAPSIFFSSFFGMRETGLFFKANRVGEAPIMVARNSIGNVFRQQAGELFQKTGNARELFLMTFKKLVLLGVIPYLILFFFSTEIFGIVFGKDWVDAGMYFRELGLYYFLQFVVSPIAVMLFLANRPKEELAWQILFSIAVFGSFLIGYFLGKPHIAVILYSIFLSAMLVYSFYLNYRFSKKV